MRRCCYMPKTLQRFYQASLRNNCPQCFSTAGLSLEFYQQWIENIWVKHTSRTVKEVLHCEHCDTEIYPVHWTDDIERVYQYHVKLAQKPSQFILKKASWLLLIAILLLLISLAYVTLV